MNCTSFEATYQDRVLKSKDTDHSSKVVIKDASHLIQGSLNL